jgi:hypothetical protein
MVRVLLLRAGYALLGLVFLALAGSAYLGQLVIAALALAFVAAVVLAFTDDELPKWAGIALLVYFVVTAAVFLLSVPIKYRAYYVDPSVSGDVSYYLFLFSPLILAAAAIVAAWERERPVRFLLVGGLVGFVIVGVFTVVLVPRGTDPSALAAAQGEANLLLALLAVSALAAAAGAFWSSARPEEYA